MKISPDIMEDVLRLRGLGKTQAELVEHVKKTHGISVSQQALSLQLKKYRLERRETSREVFETYAEKNLPADLEQMDRIHLANIEILLAIQAEVKVSRSSANVEQLTKLSSVVLKFQEQKQKALGLEDTDPIVNGLAELLALGFEEDEANPSCDEAGGSATQEPDHVHT